MSDLNGQLDPNVLQQQVMQQQMYQIQQRAFLASSLQQNLEIQKQLLQQNQQLQQLLAQAVSTPAANVAMNGSDGIMNRSTSLSSLAYPIPSPIFQGKLPTNELTICTSPKPEKTTVVNNLNSKKPFKISPISPTTALNGLIKIIPPPPPPPPPPPISPGTDVFGRAKTVRIGKWRWPPPSEGTGQTDNFIEFKRKKQIEKQDKGGVNGNSSESSDGSNTNVKSVKDALPFKDTPSEPTVEQEFKKPVAIPTNKDLVKKLSDNQAAAPGSIGKLRISLEMRAKLEQLTIDQSVRSKKDTKERGVVQSQSMDDLANMSSVKKLSEQRKALLERQLMGSLRNANTFMETTSTPNIKQTVDIVAEHNFHNKLSQENSVNSNYEPSSHVKKFIKNQQNLLRKSGSREFRERREELGPFNRLSSSSSHMNFSDRPLYTPERFFNRDEMTNGHFDTESAHSSHNGRHSSSSGRFLSSHFSSHQVKQHPIKRNNVPPPPPPSDIERINSPNAYGMSRSRVQNLESMEVIENLEHSKPVNGGVVNGIAEVDEKQVKTKLFLKNEINFYSYSKPKFRLNMRKEVSQFVFVQYFFMILL